MAIVKATKEPIKVYKLHHGDWYDYDSMGEGDLPSAPKAGKKEFTSDELIFAPK